MEDIQQLQQEFEAIRDERRVHANTAVRIGEALLSLLRLAGENDIEAVLDKLQDGTAELIVHLIKSGKGEIGDLLVKNLTVEGQMEVLRLLIRQISATAGDTVQTAAGSEIESVAPVWKANGEWTEVLQERTPDGWKCKWRNSDGDRTTRNTWVVGDQALCDTQNLVESNQEYNNYRNRHYWRLVEAVGNDFVILSAYNCERMQELGDAWNPDTDPYNHNAASIPAPKDEIVQFGYQPQPDDFDEEGGEMKRNVNRTSIRWEGSDEDGPFEGMWAAVIDYTMPGKPFVDAMNKTIDTRLVKFVSSEHNYNNSKQWVLVHNGVVLPKTVDIGDWLYYFQRDGVVRAKRLERYWYMGCQFQCSADTTACPIAFDENGEGYAAQGWELVSGVLPRLMMKMWDTGLMKFVDEVSVSWGVVRTLECSLWKNLLERMTPAVLPLDDSDVPLDGMEGWHIVGSSWRVERDSGKPGDDAAWNNMHSVAEPFRGRLTLYIGAEKNGVMTNDLNREGDGETVFTFSCEITNYIDTMTFATAMIV